MISMVLFYLAVRNLIRNSRRTILTVLSISFGLGVSLWMDCILEGRNRDVIKTVTSGHVGHLQLYLKSYKEDQALRATYNVPPPAFVEQLPQGVVSARRVHLPGLLSSGENSGPVLIEGIEPDRETKITNLKSNLIQGEYLSSAKANCENKEIIIGEKLAKRLNAEVGHKLVALAQAADGTLGNDLFYVKGIYSSQSPQFDIRYAFTSLGCAQELGALTGIHETVYHLQTEGNETKILENQNLLDQHGLVLTTWREAMPSVAVMVKFNKATLVMISALLLVVIVMGIVNTLLMSVYERTREFGVMGALGVTPWELNKLIVLESFIIGLISVAVGTVLGMSAVLYHMKFGLDLRPFLGETSRAAEFQLNLTVFPEFSFIPYLRTVVLTIVFVIGASLYPAFKASRIKPIQAMRTS
jgi:ABC-type lipoprotein release transport system permease subunit